MVRAGGQGSRLGRRRSRCIRQGTSRLDWSASRLRCARAEESGGGGRSRALTMERHAHHGAPIPGCGAPWADVALHGAPGLLPLHGAPRSPWSANPRVWRPMGGRGAPWRGGRPLVASRGAAPDGGGAVAGPDRPAARPRTPEKTAMGGIGRTGFYQQCTDGPYAADRAVCSVVGTAVVGDQGATSVNWRTTSRHSDTSGERPHTAVSDVGGPTERHASLRLRASEEKTTLDGPSRSDG
jgi:hypothetical protein